MSGSMIFLSTVNSKLLATRSVFRKISTFASGKINKAATADIAKQAKINAAKNLALRVGNSETTLLFGFDKGLPNKSNSFSFSDPMSLNGREFAFELLSLSESYSSLPMSNIFIRLISLLSLSGISCF